MTELRRLTNLGQARFSEHLQSLRSGGTEPTPFHLLTDSLTSEELAVSVEIDPPIFADRYAAGEWLRASLKSLDETGLSRDHGVWSWLGLLMLDQTCPLRPDGTRKPGEDARHILPNTYNYRKYYRHLLREAWLAVRISGDVVKPLLAGALDTRGDLLEQLSSRIELFGNPRIMAAAVRLYVDEKGKHTKLASSKAGGSPRRLATIVAQLKLTYDLRGSSADQVIGLLPGEFAT
jgi:hypothetical protein